MNERAHWGSKLGFVLAAAGSAVGLGNVWKFPYVTGENGGGAFVLIYLICVALVGLPIMTAEILIGRAAQKSPVGAFRSLTHNGSQWIALGWWSIAGSFVILSFYSVVAGWSLHYFWLSVKGELFGQSAAALTGTFNGLFASPGINLFWHAVFMGLTIAVVLGGISHGLERWARILMPGLFIMLLILLGKAFTLDGFQQGFDFVFGFHAEKLTTGGVLQALGQAFFSLSLGMGALLTYGSYLHHEDDIVSASVAISALDTLIALLASLVIFPIIFTYGLEATQGPGLIFVSIPIALSQMPGGAFPAIIFFGLLIFAALTSSISMLEVAASYLIDEKNWSRPRATLAAGGAIALFGVPAALSGGTFLFGDGVRSLFGLNWFDSMDYLASNIMLPLGGLGIAIFVGWRLNEAVRHDHFLTGSRLAFFYKSWLKLLRFLAPIAIVLVFLQAIGTL